jgi:carboxylate-amine ligase
MFKGIPLTLGVEEEYQIVDAETRALDSYVSKILPDGRVRLQDQVKEEFMQSQIEVGSQICQNVGQVREELRRLRGALIEIAEANGKHIVAAGTHPFSRWIDQTITPKLRYKALEENMQDIARRLLIFGMHVHVGIGDLELTIDIFNQARYFLPHLLALSVSSPFWDGRRTGLMSYRSVVFETLPRTGIPDAFHSYADYDSFMTTLERVGVIDDRTKVWWDVRPHPNYKTLEFRVCDVCTRIEDAVCLVAIIQSLVAFLYDLRRHNQSWRLYHRDLIRENKWRAVRYGVRGELIDFGIGKSVPYEELLEELLALIRPYAEQLGCWEEAKHARRIVKEGTSADHQLRVYDESGGDLNAVVDWLVQATREGTN